jgi:hypothetical protein
VAQPHEYDSFLAVQGDLSPTQYTSLASDPSSTLCGLTQMSVGEAIAESARREQWVPVQH